MAEYIDREKIREEVCKDCTRRIGKDGCMAPEACEDLLTALVAAEPADVVPVVHGEWKNNENEYPACTRCGYMPMFDPSIDDIYYSEYCPNCGAKMDGGKKCG